MAELRRTGSLEIAQDLAFHARQWRATRLLWLALLAIMAAAVLGLFGGGPLAWSQAGSPGAALWIDYDRVVRFGRATRVVVHARPDAAGMIRVSMDRTWLDAFQVQRVMPQPVRVGAGEAAVEYQFESEESGPAAISFDLLPRAHWTVGGRMQAGGVAIRFDQLILP